MTTFMKFEAIVWYILRIFNYICGFFGAFGVLGFVGSYELDTITTAQFWAYEFHAFCLIALAFVVYYIRECIREDVIRRAKIMKRRAKRLALAY